MQNRSAALPRRGFDVTSSAFLIVAFLTGIAGALATPTLSLFDQRSARPPGDGRLLFTGSAVIGILVSQFLAGRSDRRSDRKQLIVVCCLLGCWPACCLPWNRNYFILLFIGVFLSSFGSDRQPGRCSPSRASTPDKTGREAVMFSSILRAQVSWHGDWSPLAYALAMGFGFTAMYPRAAAAFIVCGIAGLAVLYPACIKRRRWRRAGWKPRARTAAMRCCCF